MVIEAPALCSIDSLFPARSCSHDALNRRFFTIGVCWTNYSCIASLSCHAGRRVNPANGES